LCTKLRLLLLLLLQLLLLVVVEQKQVVGGRTVGGEHWQWWHSVGSVGGGRGRGRGGGAVGAFVLLRLLLLELFQVVDEVAPGSVGAEADRVISPAQVGLVLWVPAHGAQLVVAVSKLTLFAVLAAAVLLVRATQLRLVTASVYL
jgi:hypothetical protein